MIEKRMMFQMKKFRQFVIKITYPTLISFIGGILFSLGFPTKLIPSFFLLPVIGMALFLSTLSPFSRLVIRPRFKHELIFFLAFSLGVYALGYASWIPETIRIFGGIDSPFNQFLALCLTVIVVPQYLFFVIVWRVLWRINFPKMLVPQSLFKKNFLFAALLTLCEIITPQQFPTHMGHPWLQLSPWLGTATIFGVAVFSFASFWLALSLISYFRFKRIDRYALIFFLIFICANFLLIPVHIPSKLDKTTHIRLVQANIGNHLKISSEKGDLKAARNIYSRYTDLSTAPSSLPIDLIVWPETAYPGLMSSSQLFMDPDSIPNVFRSVYSQTGAEIFWGGYDSSTESINPDNFENEYNAAFFLSGDNASSNLQLKGVYHKMKLIPFGETLPFGYFNHFVGQFIQNISYFKKGENFTFFKARNGATFIGAICYEILFSHFIRDYLNSVEKKPHFIINLTNDSWYGDTSEPLQHLFLAKWRAIEFNLPIVRMTNTGISVVLFPDGSESPRLGVFEQNHLDVQLHTHENEATLYQIYGIKTLLVLWFFIFLVLGVFDRPSRAEQKPLL